MPTLKQINAQLKDIDCNYTSWGRTEIGQLSNLLMDDEKVIMAVNGYYEGGFGLLVVTNIRVLIVDKKPFVLNLEVLRYDMISEVTYGARLLVATVHIAIPTRTIYFSSWSMSKLHKAMKHIQQNVMDARNGGGTVPLDWFLNNVTQPTTVRSVLSVGKIAKLARSALVGSGQGNNFVPRIGHNSSNRSINPYAKLPSLERRRRYPVFYK